MNGSVLRMAPTEVPFHLGKETLDDDIHAAWTVDQMPDTGMASVHTDRFIVGTIQFAVRDGDGGLTRWTNWCRVPLGVIDPPSVRTRSGRARR